MAKFLEKYQTHITIGLVLFIALGGIVLLFQEQRDKVTSANNEVKVQQADWQRQKDEMTTQMQALQKQIQDVQKQKTASTSTTNAQTGQVAGASTQNTAVTGLVNINTADLSALDTLPGIGPSKAQAIIDYRNEKGGFKSINDLKNVKGIGDATFNKLKPKITI